MCGATTPRQTPLRPAETGVKNDSSKYRRVWQNVVPIAYSARRQCLCLPLLLPPSVILDISPPAILDISPSCHPRHLPRLSSSASPPPVILDISNRGSRVLLLFSVGAASHAARPLRLRRRAIPGQSHGHASSRRLLRNDTCGARALARGSFSGRGWHEKRR